MGTRARPSPAQRDPDQLLDLFGAPLIDALGADEAATRERAARALCLLAAAESSLATPLTDRLLVRLSDADERNAVLRTLATLAAAHPDEVRTVVTKRDLPRHVRTAITDSEGWQFDAPRPDGGSDVTTLVRHVIDAGDGAVSDGPGQPSDPAVVERDATRERSSDASHSPENESSPGTRVRSAPDSAAIARRERIEQAEESRMFRAISLLGEFDDLSAVEPEQAGRYGPSLRTRATLDGEDHGVALRLFDRPDSRDARLAFAAAVAEHLAAWADIADHEGVLGVHDWGDQPRPWVATPYVEGSLADRGRVPVDRALREAVHLTRAVGHCHRNGVVHAGLDPESVVYPDVSLDGLPAPRLDNVGLLAAARHHFDPSSYLDPRYAAPEYFDRRYGTVDQATDVYQLGTTLYRLFTGRAPFSGSYDDVRETVLNDQPPKPSRLGDLPTDLDPIFTKALAKNKLTRYETVQALQAELETVLERLV